MTKSEKRRNQSRTNGQNTSGEEVVNKSKTTMNKGQPVVASTNDARAGPKRAPCPMSSPPSTM